MTPIDYKAEHRHIYLTRLGIFGLGPNDHPSADQHNLAVHEADEHIKALKIQRTEDALKELRDLKNSL